MGIDPKSGIQTKFGPDPYKKNLDPYFGQIDSATLEFFTKLHCRRRWVKKCEILPNIIYLQDEPKMFACMVRYFFTGALPALGKRLIIKVQGRKKKKRKGERGGTCIKRGNML